MNCASCNHPRDVHHPYQLDVALIRQLADWIAQRDPHDAAEAVLRSGLVVPAEPVRRVADRYDGKRTNGSAVAGHLRAILGDPQ